MRSAQSTSRTVLSPEHQLGLDSDSEAIRKLLVRTLLESLPGIGKIRAQEILTEPEVSESRRVHGLGKQQRVRLLERFAWQR
ncbi:integration host factor, actinobacterial type [Streptomyces sp. NPDC001948]